MTDTINPPPADKSKITAEEKEAYYKAFKADRPYISTENIFDGFELEFKSLSSAESDSIYHQLRKDQDSGEINNDASYLLYLTNYRLAVSLVKVDKEPYLPDIKVDTYKPVDDKDSFLKARITPIRNWPIFKLAAVLEVFKSFEDKLFELTRAVHDRSFWKAAA